MQKNAVYRSKPLYLYGAAKRINVSHGRKNARRKENARDNIVRPNGKKKERQRERAGENENKKHESCRTLNLCLYLNYVILTASMFQWKSHKSRRSSTEYAFDALTQCAGIIVVVVVSLSAVCLCAKYTHINKVVSKARIFISTCTPNANFYFAFSFAFANKKNCKEWSNTDALLVAVSHVHLVI